MYRKIDSSNLQWILISSRYVDWSGGCSTSCGTSGTGETPEAKLRRLSARPAESYTRSGSQHTL
ncbi:hypothetical protein FZC78_08785 [Rossellomorea vietnamensis]|uniref:Uncharacterized protein n=1 Tax=Rossellomorea vietnamensis TaxID=218284 RepID=A0A5D4NUM2_9BACI|nr:hypothetical protein FZC78_08785 [Rossellomorea vietnamensis]